MAQYLFTTIFSTFVVESVTGRVTTDNNPSEHLKHVQNTSLREDCIMVVFSQMEYLPWNNPDNIVSVEVETIVRRIKENIFVLFLLIGGPANVINMAVFYKQGLKDRVNLCLFSLSLADGLYLLTGIVLYGEQLVMQFTSQDRFGPIRKFVVNNNLLTLLGFCIISTVLSTIIAIERCLCVLNPLRFQTLLRTRTMATIIVFVHIVVFSLFCVVCFRNRIGCVYDPTIDVVVVTGVEGEFYKIHKEFIDGLDSYVFGVGLPGVQMIVVTTTTVMTIVKLRQVMTWRSETSTTDLVREVALTKMLVRNSIFFIFCIFPIACIRFSWVFFPEMNPGRRQQNFFYSGLWITEIFTYIKATFNIFVYYSMGSRYRETLWALLSRKPQSGKV